MNKEQEQEQEKYCYCGMKINDEHKSALYLDFGIVRCQYCGNKVDYEQAQKFLDYNNIKQNNN